MAKPGPKPKITEEVTGRILAILTVGGSLSDAADIVGVRYQTIINKRKADPDFLHRLNKAVKEGKMNHIRKVGSAKPWQASAFMLERKWWKEFARKDKITAEHTGKGGGAIKHEVKASFEYDSFEREIADIRTSAGRSSAPAGLPPANGN